MANFSIAYNNFVKPWEGGYANVPGDKGLETYAGISRRFFPDWDGWPFIDKVKAQIGAIANNKFFSELTPSVEKFYYNLWVSTGASKINDQNLANIIFDYIVNSGKTGVKNVQKIVGVTQDGILGNNTAAAINNSNPIDLYNAIKQQRIEFYKMLAERPNQSQFLPGWLNRINSFPTLTKVAGVSIGLLAFAGLILYMIVEG